MYIVIIVVIISVCVYLVYVPVCADSYGSKYMKVKEERLMLQ